MQSTSPILLDDSPPTSPGKNNLSILTKAVAHTVVDRDNVEKEDDTPLSVFFGSMKKRKIMLSARKDPTEG